MIATANQFHGVITIATASSISTSPTGHATQIADGKRMANRIVYIITIEPEPITYIPHHPEGVVLSRVEGFERHNIFFNETFGTFCI